MTLRHAIAALIVAVSFGLHAAKAASPAGGKPAPAAAGDDLGLIDWSIQPFSDQGSHFVLARQGSGFSAWGLRSAFAFGGMAATAHPAKDLFKWRFELVIEGAERPLFEGLPSVMKSYPRWIEETVEQDGFSAASTLLFPATDVVVGACNLVNRSKKALRLRLVLVLEQSLPGLDATLSFEPEKQLLNLELNRGKLAQRKLTEFAAVMVGNSRWRLDQVLKSSLAPVSAGAPLALKDGFELRLSSEAPVILAPGQGLRVPFLFSVGQTRSEAKESALTQWRLAALPKGTAYQAVKARWAQTRAALPQATDAAQATLLRRAALTLLSGEYARRGQLSGAMFPAAKGSRDAFFSVETPLAALGWAELDHGKAEEALLQLTSFSSAAPAPVPPHTGEELLLWEATGLPLHGWAAFELYHRDPDANRANSFLSTLAGRLRNECAYWPAARDGDGNGLYAFSREEEKPWYMIEGQSLSAATEPQPLSATVVLQKWSAALTSFVAFQFQAGSALAGQASQAEEADKLIALSVKSVQALAAEALAAPSTSLDTLWPWVLGLSQDAEKGRAEIEAKLLPLLTPGTMPFLEDGRVVPWRAYAWLRLLCQFGYLDQARSAASALLSALARSGCLYTAHDASGSGLGSPGDAATAASVLAMSLGRHEQEVDLLPWTQSIEARLIQVRTLDGSFYLKRLRLPAQKAAYSKMRLKSLKNGSILEEKGFILDADEDMVLSLVSEKPLQISEIGKSKRMIFAQAKKADMIVRKKLKYEVIFKEN